jgi:hypothetical protein
MYDLAVLKLRAECERALIALTRAKTYTASVEALMEGYNLLYSRPIYINGFVLNQAST